MSWAVLGVLTACRCVVMEGWGVALAFVGLWCLALALVVVARRLPSRAIVALGIAMAVGAAGWCLVVVL